MSGAEAGSGFWDKIFQEDIVCRVGRRNTLGVVQRCGWDVFDDEEDEDDEAGGLSPRAVEVAWSGESRLMEVDPASLEVVDRSMFPGDVVRSQQHEGMSGTVTAARLTLDVEYSSDGLVRRSVPAELVRHVHQFLVEGWVVRGDAAGVLVDIYETVTLDFADGRACTIESASPEVVWRDFDPEGTGECQQDGSSSDVVVPYSPGDHVWVKTAGRNKAERAVVRKVVPATLRINWVSVNGNEHVPDEVSSEGVVALPAHLGLQWNIEERGIARPQVRFARSEDLADSPVAAEGSWEIEGDHTLDVVVIRGTHTWATVKWQDGSVSQDVLATELIPVLPSESDVWPDEFVTKTTRPENPTEGSDDDVFGCVRSVNTEEKMAVVAWENRRTRIQQEESVSLYLLAPDRRFQFRFGDAVARIPDDDDPQAEQRPWVGQIVGMNHGRIRVTWFDGSESQVGPFDLILLEDESADYDTEEDFDDDEEEGESQEETQQEAGGIESGSLPEMEEFRAVEVVPPAASSAASAAHATPASPTTAPAGGPSADEYGLPLVRVLDQLPAISLPAPPAALSPAFGKRIMKEWSAISARVAPHIFVRMCDSRIDLMSLLIIGPAGTPYGDGLFVFDVHLPPEYPNVPPNVLYRSVTPRLHPILYEDGRVCLSLLGTWSSGDQCEKWQPGTSNLLQVILSIQGLIIGLDDPYFAEPGFETQKGTPAGTKASHEYNEAATLHVVQSMTRYAFTPPVLFEDVATAHFAIRGPSILSRLRATLGPLSAAPANSQRPAFSEGFRSALRTLLPAFERALLSATSRHATDHAQTLRS